MLFLIFSHLQIAFWQSQCTCPEQVLRNVEETMTGRGAIAESSPTKARKPALDYLFRWFNLTPLTNPAVPELPR
jgi:hypothetical protein